MNEEEFVKWVSKLMLNRDKRPFAPGEKECFKKLIDDSESPEQFMLSFAVALNHPLSSGQRKPY